MTYTIPQTEQRFCRMWCDQELLDELIDAYVNDESVLNNSQVAEIKAEILIRMMGNTRQA